MFYWAVMITNVAAVTGAIYLIVNGHPGYGVLLMLVGIQSIEVRKNR